MLRKMLGLDKAPPKTARPRKTLRPKVELQPEPEQQAQAPQLFDPFVPGVAEWIETAEVLLVSKRERVVEELRARVETHEQKRPVSAQLRHTEVEVDRQ